ncbi:hypothetical protein BDM02DRAFT_3133121 [Thelephora ganbajun]|uniref:Uncharacterized protein n=1 Tax=Thelephora ganbajun TaxID=370292 RepID=A0ACB6YYU2_THEGA|nr:hypothetical protein BDM02DRAFT_3133121 [Thelephora ganbajun]
MVLVFLVPPLLTFVPLALSLLMITAFVPLAMGLPLIITMNGYEELFNGLHDVIDETRDDVRKIAHHIAANSTRQIPGIESSGIPLVPKKSDYPHLKYWNQAPWQEIRNGTRVKDIDSPVLSLFFEDESGNLVSDEVKEEVRGDLYAYWLDMVTDKEIPVHYNGLSLRRQEDYRKTMEGKYPWLRLCEGHWKVKQIWVSHWKKDRFPSLAPKKPKRNTLADVSSGTKGSQPAPKEAKSETLIELSSDTNNSSPAPKETKSKIPIKLSSDTEDSSPAPKKPKILIELSTDTEDSSPTPIKPTSNKDNVSAGSKRRRGSEDPDAGSSKKWKGKGRDAEISGLHPPRPQPKRKNPAKMGKDEISDFPPSANIQVTSTVSNTPSIQNTSVVLGSGTIHSSPPHLPTPEQTLCTTSRDILEALNATIAAPLTQAEMPLDKLSCLATPEFSPDPRPPKITPIVATATSLSEASDKNSFDKDLNNVATSSSPPEPAGVPTKKRGPFPWKRVWCKEWMEDTKGTKRGFDKYLKGVDPKAKEAKIDALKLTTANKK